MFIPQVVKAATQRMSGVSPASWALALVTSICWMIYGMMIHEWVLIYPSAVMGAGAGYVFIKALGESRFAVVDLREPATAAKK